jgi:hypothetical protein
MWQYGEYLTLGSCQKAVGKQPGYESSNDIHLATEELHLKKWETKLANMV